MEEKNPKSHRTIYLYAVEPKVEKREPVYMYQTLWYTLYRTTVCATAVGRRPVDTSGFRVDFRPPGRRAGGDRVKIRKRVGVHLSRARRKVRRPAGQVPSTDGRRVDRHTRAHTLRTLDSCLFCAAGWRGASAPPRGSVSNLIFPKTHLLTLPPPPRPVRPIRSHVTRSKKK